MPELPEVETVTRDLRQKVLGASLTGISQPQRQQSARILRLPLPSPHEISAWSQPTPMQAIVRRAKYIVCQVGSEHFLLAHLGMTGAFHYNSATPAGDFAKHCHLRFNFTQFSLEYHDPRRFGFVCLLPRLNLDFSRFFAEELSNHELKMQIQAYLTLSETTQRPVTERSAMRYLHNIGVEPFSNEFSSEFLANLQQRRGNPVVKQLLMDNSLIAGIGNIYASESLFLAGISPLRRFKSLNYQELANIVRTARHVLAQAINQRGSSIVNYRDLGGNSGQFQNSLFVYGKKNLLCSKCARHIIERCVIAGRASYWCPGCQI